MHGLGRRDKSSSVVGLIWVMPACVECIGDLQVQFGGCVGFLGTDEIAEKQGRQWLGLSRDGETRLTVVSIWEMVMIWVVDFVVADSVDLCGFGCCFCLVEEGAGIGGEREQRHGCGDGGGGRES